MASWGLPPHPQRQFLCAREVPELCRALRTRVRRRFRSFPKTPRVEMLSRRESVSPPEQLGELLWGQVLPASPQRDAESECGHGRSDWATSRVGGAQGCSGSRATLPAFSVQGQDMAPPRRPSPQPSLLVCRPEAPNPGLQFNSVAQSCLTLCNPKDRSTPALPVHHQLPEFSQTHVHRVGDAIQPSHPLSSPSPPTFNLSQHQGLFQGVNSSHQVAKVLEFQLQHQSFQ